jgi:hypothetical protein
MKNRTKETFLSHFVRSKLIIMKAVEIKNNRKLSLNIGILVRRRQMRNEPRDAKNRFCVLR